MSQERKNSAGMLTSSSEWTMRVVLYQPAPIKSAHDALSVVCSMGWSKLYFWSSSSTYWENMKVKTPKINIKFIVKQFLSASHITVFADGTEVHTAVLKLQVFHSKSPFIYAVLEGWIFGLREPPVVWICTIGCVHNEGHGLPWTLPVPVHLAMTRISVVAAVHLCRLGHVTPADVGVLGHMLAVNCERKIKHSL